MLKQIAHHYEVYLHILYSNYSVIKQVHQRVVDCFTICVLSLSHWWRFDVNRLR